MKRTEIIDKIAKLLALAADGSNEHESNLAMQRAHALMQQYNLTLTDVERQEASGTLGKVVVTLTTKTMPAYANYLSASLMETFGLVGFYMSARPPARKATVTLIGRNLNRQLAAHLLVSVLQQITNLATSKQRATGWGRSAMFDYRTGLALGICDRIAEVFGTKTPDGSTEFGLIKVGADVLAREAARFALTTEGYQHKMGQSHYRKSSSFAEGYSDSSRASIARPVAGGGFGQPQRLGS